MKLPGIVVALLAVAAGCAKKKHVEPVEKMVTTDAATPTDAAVAVAEPDAPPEPPRLPLEEVLGLGAAEPPATLGGLELGVAIAAPPPGEGHGRPIGVTGWDATVTPTVVDGKVTRITAVFAPREAIGLDADGSGDVEPEAYEKAIADAMRLPAARWKKSVTWHGRTGYVGAASQMFFAHYDGFLGDTAALVVDVVPLDDTVVCGPRDGFAAFQKTFDAAIARKNLAALDAVLDRKGEEHHVMECGDDATAVTCVAALRRSMRREKPFCNLSAGQYYLTTPSEGPHGGTFFWFTRDAAGWKAHGPHNIGHDDDPSPTSPYGY